jgi:cysteine desulfurase
MFKSRIYLDYASLAPIDPRVMREMEKYSSRAYANPSSLYTEGVAAKKALALGREKVADYINAHADEIIFTSGGTEANNLAIKGVARSAVQAGMANPHIIVSAIEHSSIVETVAELEKRGCQITRLSVDSCGIVSLDELKKAIRPNTILVSIMAVNNEIGSVQPIKEIAKIVRQARKLENAFFYPLLHTDAAQALYEEMNMDNFGVDMLTLDGGKVYGPRGVGALYIKRGTPIEAVANGGGQENSLRPGTENLPGIRGFAKALEIMKLEIRNQKIGEKIGSLKKQFIEGLKKIRPDIIINGCDSAGGHDDVSRQSPHILNVSIPGIDNEFFLFKLDARGIACSTKSSCLRDEEESYVLKAIGADGKISIRFSFGRWTKKADIKRALKAVSESLAS